MLSTTIYIVGINVGLHLAKDFDVVGNRSHILRNIAVEQLQKVSTHSHLTFGATLQDFL
jgi:hypothetical protein